MSYNLPKKKNRLKGDRGKDHDKPCEKKKKIKKYNILYRMQIYNSIPKFS